MSEVLAWLAEPVAYKAGRAHTDPTLGFVGRILVGGRETKRIRVTRSSIVVAGIRGNASDIIDYDVIFV